MTELAGSPSQVTVGDLFRVMSEMNLRIAAAVTKLEVIDARNMRADELHRDIETRVRLLEATRSRWAGAAVAVGGIAGIASGILSNLIQLHH